MASLDFSHEESSGRRAITGRCTSARSSSRALGLRLSSLLRGRWVGPLAPRRRARLGRRAAAWAALVVARRRSCGCPLSFWRGTPRAPLGLLDPDRGGWLADQAEGVAIGLVLDGGVLGRGSSGSRALPSALAGGRRGRARARRAFLSFVAPVVLEPLFNRFRPLDDARSRAAARARRARGRAGARRARRRREPADAKVNAYVSGLGATRRVVVLDTLLDAVDAA